MMLDKTEPEIDNRNVAIYIPVILAFFCWSGHLAQLIPF